MKIKHTIAFLFCIALLPLSGSRVNAQEVNAALAEFTPEAFDGYPQKGTFLATFGKTSGTVPAGTAQVIFTMVPEVPLGRQADHHSRRLDTGIEFDPDQHPFYIDPGLDK